MLKKRIANPKGFTLVELMVATTLAIVVISGVGLTLADSHRGWNRMYNRIYSDVVTDGYVARKTFDSVVRNASKDVDLLDSAGSWLEVYYYADANSTVVDRYGLFYLSSSELKLEYGSLDPRMELGTRTICSDVSFCVFKAAGQSAQMILTLDDGSQTLTVATSAVMHN